MHFWKNTYAFVFKFTQTESLTKGSDKDIIKNYLLIPQKDSTVFYQRMHNLKSLQLLKRKLKFLAVSFLNTIRSLTDKGNDRKSSIQMYL